MLPWLAGVTPFGLVIGVAAGQTSFAGAGWLTAPAIYGGSAQIAAIQLLDSGAATLAVIGTVLVINLRLVLYSAALSRYWRHTPLWWRLLAGYLLIDPSFVVGERRYGDDRAAPGGPAHAFYLGAALALWAGWLVAVGAGAVAGAVVPPGLHLELLVPLYLIGQVLPELRQRASRRAVLVSGAVAVAGLAAPLHLGIAAGIVAGLVAGALATRPSRPAPAQPLAPQEAGS
jgi:predicted branched-subunit amino acid permease